MRRISFHPAAALAVALAAAGCSTVPPLKGTIDIPLAGEADFEIGEDGDGNRVVVVTREPETDDVPRIALPAVQGFDACVAEISVNPALGKTLCDCAEDAGVSTPKLRRSCPGLDFASIGELTEMGERVVVARWLDGNCVPIDDSKEFEGRVLCPGAP